MLRQALLFTFYVGCMLGFTFVMASCALGGFRNGWRYMGILVRHVAALAVLGIVIAAVIQGFQ